MTTAWTETHTYWQATGTGWQNYDIYTNKSVPKGAIAYIVCVNQNDATDVDVGVRADGSSLERRVNLHEAEGGGADYCAMYVKVDSSTGYIETYASTTTNCYFFLMGYWTGVEFTELWESISASGTGWQTYTLTDPPASRVVQIVFENRYASAKRSMGCRATTDTTHTKMIDVHEAEGTDADCCDACTMHTKLNASKQLSIYFEMNDSSNLAHCSGYFDSTMSYADMGRADSAVDITTGSTWTDKDLTSVLDQDGRVCDCVCYHSTTDAEKTCGARKNGSSLGRYLNTHEAESNGYCGVGIPTESDTNGIIEFYCASTTTVFMGIWGYYIPDQGAFEEKSTTDSISFADTPSIVKTITITESIGSVDTPTLPSKLLTLAEALGLSETIKYGIILQESIGMAEETPLTKIVNITEAVQLAEGVLMEKTVGLVDALTFDDTVKLEKAILLAETISATDLPFLTKLVLLTDALNMGESVQLGIALTETMNFDEAVGLVKSIVEGDTITLDEIAEAFRFFFLQTSDAISFGDVCSLAKYVFLTDSVALDENAQVVLKSLLVGETMTFDDVVSLVKLMSLGESMTLGDVVQILKTVSLTDTLDFNDAVLIEKLIYVSETLGLDENAFLPGSFIHLYETISFLDVPQLTKDIQSVESLSLSESVGLVKSLLVLDSLGLTDEVLLSKLIVLAEDISLDELDTMTKSLVAVEGLTLQESVSIIKSVLEVDALVMSEDVSMVKQMVLTDDMTLSETVQLLKDLHVIEDITFSEEVTKTFFYLITLRLAHLLGQQSGGKGEGRKRKGRTIGTEGRAEVMGRKDDKEMVGVK